MSMVSDAIIAGIKSAQTAVGSSVTYTRAAVGSVTLTAVPGDSVHQTTTSSGYVSETRSKDFIFLVSELLLAGSGITPARGDTITDGSTTYDVLAVGGETHWRYTDPTHVAMRVHCKE